MIDDRVNNLIMCEGELYVYVHATRMNGYLCGERRINRWITENKWCCRWSDTRLTLWFHVGVDVQVNRPLCARSADNCRKRYLEVHGCIHDNARYILWSFLPILEVRRQCHHIHQQQHHLAWRWSQLWPEGTRWRRTATSRGVLHRTEGAHWDSQCSQLLWSQWQPQVLIGHGGCSIVVGLLYAVDEGVLQSSCY